MARLRISYLVEYDLGDEGFDPGDEAGIDVAMEDLLESAPQSLTLRTGMDYRPEFDAVGWIVRHPEWGEMAVGSLLTDHIGSSSTSARTSMAASSIDRGNRSSERRTHMSVYDEMQDEIVRGAKFLHDAAGRTGALYENASTAGAKLAAEVYRFTQDPEAVGTDALEAAYGEFMGLHSAGFTDSAREASAV